MSIILIAEEMRLCLYNYSTENRTAVKPGQIKFSAVEQTQSKNAF